MLLSLFYVKMFLREIMSHSFCRHADCIIMGFRKENIMKYYMRGRKMKIEQEMIDGYLQACKNKRLSGHSLKAYRIDLKQAFVFFENSEVTKTTLNDYVEVLNQQYKPKTIKRKLAVLHSFFDYLVYDEQLEVNPMSKSRIKIKEGKRIPRIIKTEDLRQIIKELDSDKNEDSFILRDKAVIELLIGTGVRVSELCSLKKEDIDFEQQYIRVNGKGSKERVIYLGQTVLLALSLYYCRYEEIIRECGYFFINNAGRPISDQSVRYIIRKYSIHTETHITPHMFRHTFATMLLEQDVDIAYIQKILGHSSITTTTIYAYVSNARQKEILVTKNPRELLKD